MSRLKLDKVAVFTVTLTPSQVTNGQTVTQTFTVPGLRVGDVILEISKATNQNGLAVISGTVPSEKTLGVTFANYSASPITPTAAEVYTVIAMRPDLSLPGGAAVFN